LSKRIRWWCIPPALPRPPGCFLCLPMRPCPALTCPLFFRFFLKRVVISRGAGGGGGVLEICCFGFERRRVNQSERLGFGRCIYATENEGNFRLTVLPSSFGMWSRQLKVGFGKWAPLLGSFSFLSLFLFSSLFSIYAICLKCIIIYILII